MKRNKIAVRKIAGESAGLDKSVADDFVAKKLPLLIKEYSPKDIFNADEAALYLETMPDRTLHFRGVGCKGTKTRKDRVTMMVCANMDGSEKKQLLIIGKSKNPRCFKNLNINNLPVNYEANTNAWMTTTIMTKWLVEWDEQLAENGRKILLFLDNCSAHPPRLQESLMNIKLEFFPPNMTPFLQPMDMGVISNMKFYYRLKMVRFLLSHIGNPNRPKVSLLDAVDWISEIWSNQVKPETVANCFKKAGFYTARDNISSDDLYENVEFLDLEFENYGISNEDLNEWNQITTQLGVDFDFETAISIDSEVQTSDVPDVHQSPDLVVIEDDSGFGEDLALQENLSKSKIDSALETIETELNRTPEVPSNVNNAFTTLKDFLFSIII